MIKANKSMKLSKHILRERRPTAAISLITMMLCERFSTPHRPNTTAADIGTECGSNYCNIKNSNIWTRCRWRGGMIEEGTQSNGGTKNVIFIQFSSPATVSSSFSTPEILIKKYRKKFWQRWWRWSCLVASFHANAAAAEAPWKSWNIFKYLRKIFEYLHKMRMASKEF